MAGECVGNLGPGGRTARLRIGIVGLGVGLLLSIVLLRAGVDRPVRLVVFLPFLLAASGVMQVMLRTCPSHGRRGTREADGAAVPMHDPKREAGARTRSSVVVAATLGLAGLATGAVWVLP